MDENTFFDIIEQAHRERTRTGQFCYVATEWVGGLWRLSIVEQDVAGHFPVSEDFYNGCESAAKRKAVELNSRRLDLGPREAARIVASSMAGR